MIYGQISDFQNSQLNIEIINKIDALNSSFERAKIRELNQNIVISNDVFSENKPDSSIDIKNYISLIDRYNSSYKLIINDIYSPEKINKNVYLVKVNVTKIIHEKYACLSDSVKQDTIQQKIILNAEMDEDSFWDLTIQKIETIDPKGRRIRLKTKGSKYYFQRFGLFIPIKNENIEISPEEYLSNPNYTPYIYLKDLNGPIDFKKIGNKKYSNYYDLFEQNKPIENACEQVATMNLKIGSNGYFSVTGGVDVGIAPPKLNIHSSIVPFEQISINRSSYNNAHFEIQQNWYWKLPFRIVTGIGYSNMQFSFESAIDTHQDAYQSVDADGGSYIRTVNYANMSDRLKLNYHAFPIQLGLDVELFWKKIDIFKEHKLMLASAFTCTPMLNYKVTSERSANINYSGTYSDLFNITLAENGVYDFGNYSVLPTNTEILDKANLNWCIGLDLGLKCYFKENWFVSILANHSWIPTSIFPNQENDYLSKNNSELNSYLANISDSKLEMWSISMNVGFVLPKKK